jgi:hypothetical protein
MWKSPHEPHRARAADDVSAPAAGAAAAKHYRDMMWTCQDPAVQGLPAAGIATPARPAEQRHLVHVGMFFGARRQPELANS